MAVCKLHPLMNLPLTPRAWSLVALMAATGLLGVGGCRKEPVDSALLPNLESVAPVPSGRAMSDRLVVRLPGALPLLNPYVTADEAGRQVLDLLHEPLVRYDREGRLAPALAEEWKWRQEMTCWFASPEAARAAAHELHDLPAERRSRWDLEAISTEAEALHLRFIQPGGVVTADVGQVLTASRPVRLSFLRILAPPSAQLALESFAHDPQHAPHTKRLSFAEDGTCEMVCARPALLAQQQLTQWLASRHHPMPEIQLMDEASALVEPVLDFRLRSGATWPDGSAITVQDVRATLTQMLVRPWPMVGKEAFQHIQEIGSPEPGLVRVTYRRAHSPALPGWTLLPILPAAWLAQHVSDFAQAEPPGAGAWQLTRREVDHLFLEKKAGQGMALPIRQIMILRAQAGAEQVDDVTWSAPLPLAVARSYQPLLQPVRYQLMLMWHTEAPLLKQPQVRHALSLAVDRRELRSRVSGMALHVHDGFFPPGCWFSPKEPATDLELTPGARHAQALELLKSEGWLQDVDGRLRQQAQVMQLRLVIPAEDKDRQQLAEALVATWKLLGIEVLVTKVPAGSYMMELQAGRFDIALVASDFTPGWDVLPWWHSSQRSGLGPNVSQLADAQLDLLLEALMTEFNPVQTPGRVAAVEARLRLLKSALPLFTDQDHLHVLRTRFPALSGMTFPRGCTLRDLLPALINLPRPTKPMRMLAPD